MSKSWKAQIPTGWQFSMAYNQKGDGYAIFKNPLTGERHRIGASFDLGWDSKKEPFGAAALRKLFRIRPDLTLPKEPHHD